jgi:hypothetical protein
MSLVIIGEAAARIEAVDRLRTALTSRDMLSGKQGVGGCQKSTDRHSHAKTVGLGLTRRKGIRTGPATKVEAFSDANHSLWLENITEWGAQTDLCWLMWYDKNGNPLINVSGIVGKKDLPELSKRLADFIQVP